MQISAITTYPLKGFAGQNHEQIDVTAFQLLPGDRAFGLSSGTTASQEASSDSWLKKAHFLQLMNLESLAHFNVQFDETNHMLGLSLDQKIVYEGCLTKAEDAARLSDYIAHYLGYEPTQDKPRLFHLQEGGLTDTKTPYIAFGNQASMDDFAKRAHIHNDASRYRLNIMIDGLDAFAEMDLIGQTARIGTAEFEFIEPVGRCAAIDVDPRSGKRRGSLVRALQHHYGHTNMGVFARVSQSGHIGYGDKLEIISSS